MTEVLNSLSMSLERLSVAASALEVSATRIEAREAAMSGEVEKITAAVESGSERLRREQELERKLLQAEQRIADLLAAGEPAPAARAASARKTLPAATVQLLAKQGIHSLDSIECNSLDAALSGLSIEQRIAVKSQLLRTGVIS